MATTSTANFQTMLNQYLNYDLLKEELLKRDYFLNKIEKDSGWKGGSDDGNYGGIVVPFQGAYASSIRFGSLTNESDIAQDIYARGVINHCPEVWGTMYFNHKDIVQSGGRINEDTFLQKLPDQLDNFMQNFKNAISQSIFTGKSIAKFTVNGTALGVAVVDHVERFTIGQRLDVRSDAPLNATAYVRSIDINENKITVYNARTGGAVLDISTYLVADAARFEYHDANANGMTSLRDCLLSQANGGSATIYGVNKLLYPYTQAININGSTITSSNILEKLFDAFNTVRKLGKGNPSTALVSWKWMANIMKKVEDTKGAFKVNPNDTKASIYGWTTISITGTKGMLEVTSIQEMDDDIIILIDWSAMKFFSNGFIQKRMSPDGNEYFELRAESGYKYIIDLFLMGDLVVHGPSRCGIIHSIP